MYFNSNGAHLNRYSGVLYDMLIQVSFDRNDLHQQIMNKVLEGVLLAASCGKTLPARTHRKMSYRLDPFIYSSDRLLLSAFHCCWFVKKFINNNNNDGWKKQAMTGKIKPTAKKTLTFNPRLYLLPPPSSPSYHWKDKISKMKKFVFLSRCWCTFRERIHIFNLSLRWCLIIIAKIKTITLFIACLYKTCHYLVCRS